MHQRDIMLGLGEYLDKDRPILYYYGYMVFLNNLLLCFVEKKCLVNNIVLNTLLYNKKMASILMGCDAKIPNF